MTETGPQRIVYVDDDHDLRVLFRTVLERAGYDGVLVTCGSGQELLDRVRVLRPDVIILDLRMPVMNGPDTLSALRQMEGVEDTPVIFLTGADKVHMQGEYERLGVIGVLHKPFSTKTLLSEICDLYHKAQAV